MAYSTDITKLLTDQLTKFATLNRHQLAGQLANLDFWLAEVHHCFKAIDGYGARYRSLKRAQVQHVSEHRTTWFDLDEPYITGPVEPPHRAPDGALQEARRGLCDAAYRFLIRCFNEGLLEVGALRKACDGVGIGVEPGDLKAKL
jgi:hypothetical protein